MIRFYVENWFMKNHFWKIFFMIITVYFILFPSTIIKKNLSTWTNQYQTKKSFTYSVLICSLFRNWNISGCKFCRLTPEQSNHDFDKHEHSWGQALCWSEATEAIEATRINKRRPNVFIFWKLYRTQSMMGLKNWKYVGQNTIKNH